MSTQPDFICMIDFHNDFVLLSFGKNTNFQNHDIYMGHAKFLTHELSTFLFFVCLFTLFHSSSILEFCQLWFNMYELLCYTKINWLVLSITNGIALVMCTNRNGNWNWKCYDKLYSIWSDQIKAIAIEFVWFVRTIVRLFALSIDRSLCQFVNKANCCLQKVFYSLDDRSEKRLSCKETE